MKKASLKNNKFEYIQVTGNVVQFSELKRFCGNKIHIQYESCCVDDYWLIQLDDDLKEKKVIIPNGDYIVKFSGDNIDYENVDDEVLYSIFTVVSSQDFDAFFEKVD